MTTVWQTELADLAAPRRGKVRDIYDLGDELLLVASDRLSAYDWVLRPGIPDKGKMLNQLTNHWFAQLDDITPNHLLVTRFDDLPEPLRRYRDQLEGRSVLVRKSEVVPFECVARGYLAGSAFREYKETGRACGHELPSGLERASRLPEPIFTPATKAEQGHDINIDFDTLVGAIGGQKAETLRELTLRLYRHGAEQAAKEGLLLADTKFEFGYANGQLLLIDEVLTPDSSRYWEADAWQPGTEPASFDKQFVRNWLDDTGWDKESEPPELPAKVVAGTRARYLEAFERLTGQAPEL